MGKHALQFTSKYSSSMFNKVFFMYYKDDELKFCLKLPKYNC